MRPRGRGSRPGRYFTTADTSKRELQSRTPQALQSEGCRPRPGDGFFLWRRDHEKAAEGAAAADDVYHRLVSHRHEDPAPAAGRRSFRALADAGNSEMADVDANVRSLKWKLWHGRREKSSRCNGQSGALIFYFRFGPPFSTAIFASASRTSRRNKPIDRGSRGCSSRHRRCSRRLNTPANLSVPFSTGSGDAFPGLNSYGPTLATTPIRSKTPSLDRRGSSSKSSSARSTSKVSSCRPVDGSSSEFSWFGHTTAASPRTMRTSLIPSPRS